MKNQSDELVTRCAWCSPPAPETTDGDLPVLRVSHGICKPCADRVEADARASGESITIDVAITTAAPTVDDA